MDKGKAIELLKKELSKIPRLRELYQDYDNQKFKLWHDGVRNIIKAALDTDDFRTFSSSQSIPIKGIHPDSVYEEYYLSKLTDYETALKLIIRKYKILGIEEEPAVKTELKDTVKLPIQLFDALQFHPKVIEASRSCFVSSNYREAILNAFISFIDYIKEMTELDLDGDDLMNQVFSFNYDREQKKITKYPIIRINELKNKTDRDEQHGFMFLCKGAAAFIRNPKAHKLIAQTDPLHTLEYLAFASLLFRRFDERKINTP